MLCWHPNPQERPSFTEIEHFLKVDAMQDIQGDVESGKIRRTSTSGSLALRILATKRTDNKEEETVETIKERVNEMRETIKQLEEENARLRIKEMSTRGADTT